MEIKITKKQNVKVDGVKYVAKATSSCGGCAFNNRAMLRACEAAYCAPEDRNDSGSVIFVRKVSKKAVTA